jgi:hypothetical protein
MRTQRWKWIKNKSKNLKKKKIQIRKIMQTKVRKKENSMLIEYRKLINPRKPKKDQLY